MQIILTEEEFEKLKNLPRLTLTEARKEVMGVLTEEFKGVKFREDNFAGGGAVVKLSELKLLLERVKERLQ